MHLSIIDRYLIKNATIAMLVICFVGTMVIWLTQALRLLELVVERGAPISMLLYMMLLSVPAFLSLVLPLGLTVGVLFVMHKLLMDSELVVLQATGQSYWRITRPILILSLMTVVVGLFVTLFLAPLSNSLLAREEFLAKNDYALVLLRDGSFNRLNEGVTAYVRERVGNEEIRGLLLHDESKPEKSETLIAERGLLVDTPAGKRLVLVNGIRQERERQSGHISELRFEQYALDLSQFGTDFDDRNQKPREMPTWKFFNKDVFFSNDIYWTKLAAEFHGRLASPLLAVGFAMVVMALLLTATINRRGMMGRLVISAGIVILWQVAVIASINFIPKNPMLAGLLYAQVLLPVPYLLIVIKRGYWGWRRHA